MPGLFFGLEVGKRTLVAQEFDDQCTSVEGDFNNRIGDVNQLAGLIASLNHEIVRNAQAISELRIQRVMSSGSLMNNEYSSGLVGNLGTKTQVSDNLSNIYNLVTTQLANARESAQGVSIDEEMTNMMKYQRANETAARVITYVDTDLETVVSGMGVTR